MPTIKDIAKHAGVSQGTVSNVLNGKGIVSVEKINLVKQAAQELGYKINEKAKFLRQGVSREIAVIIPNLDENGYADLYVAIRKDLLLSGYTVKLFLTMDMPAIEKSIIKELYSVQIDGMITVSCLSNPEKYYTSDFLSEVKTIFIVRRPNGCNQFIGFDDEAAARDIAEKVVQSGSRNIGLFSNTIDQAEDLFSSLSEYFNKLDIAYFLVNSENSKAKFDAFQFIQRKEKIDTIITGSLQLAKAVEAAYFYGGLENKPKIITISPARIMNVSPYAEYQLDYLYLGKTSANTLLDWIENGNQPPAQTIVKNSGFRKNSIEYAENEQDAALNILMVQSPTADVLQKIAPLFKKLTGIELRFITFSYDETYNAISNFGESGMYDVIRMDMAWLSWFAQSTLLPIGESDMTQEIYDRFLPELLDQYCVADGVKYAFPFDPSVQILFYRKDLFEDAKLRRGYFEKYRCELTVPKTFKELNQIAEYFTKSFNPESPTDYGMTMATGNSGMISCEVMPRIFDYSGSFVDENGNFQLSKKETIEAVVNYVKTTEYCSKQVVEWWDSAVKQFASGGAAMTIVFANHAADIIRSQFSKVAGKIGYAPIPGNKPLLGGGVLGISKNSTRVEMALRFIDWVCSDEISLVISVLGGVSASKIVYDNPEVIEKYPWFKTVKECFAMGVNRNTCMGSSRHIDERKVEHILGMAIKNVLLGTMTPEQAMQFAEKSIEK